MRKFVFASDSHGDMVCDKSVRSLVEFCKSWKPHIRIHGGDFIDCRSLRKGASPDEIQETFAEDIDAADSMFEMYRPNVVLCGNHDIRLWDALNGSNGFAASAAQVYIDRLEKKMKSLKAQMLPYHIDKGVFDYHGIKFNHGYRATTYPAKAQGEVFGNSICGHVHRFDSHSLKMHGGGTSMTSGCLCRLEDLGYMDRIPGYLAQEKGFIYGIVNEKTGSWNAWNAKEIDGKIVFP